jgi:hypothetical protein
MPSKPIEIPPQAAKAFVRDMRAYISKLQVTRLMKSQPRLAGV